MTNETLTAVQKYEIDKKYEIQNKKFDEASNIQVGNLNIAAISLMAEKFSKAGDLIPKEFQGQTEKCFVAIYKGASLGIDAFTALQRIAVVNGRATIWGDTALSLVRKSGLLEKFKEEILEVNGKLIARCIVKRKGEDEHVSEFSQQDAEMAKLWGRNVWASYPKRMLKYRARAFALRDIFADVLDGLYLKEEMEGDENFNKEPKNVTPPEQRTNQENFKAISNETWFDDAKKDFPNTPDRVKKTKKTETTETGYKNYNQLLEILSLCETKESFELFEKECEPNLQEMQKSNLEEYEKLMAMIMAMKGDIE